MTARVVSPEAVPLELETASIGSRSLALLIDWVVQAALLAGLLVAVAAAQSSVHGPGWAAVTIAVFLVFAVVWGYPVAMETLWRGRTLGKAALGLRVVTKEGGQVRFRHAAVRAALGLVDFALTSGAAAVVSVLATRDNQRLGDLAAGTVVLRERTGLRAPEPADFAVPAGLEAYAASLDLSGLTAQDYGLVRAFLLRAPSLPGAVRSELAEQVADPVVGRLRPAPPPGIAAETFLACVAAVYQQRQSRAGGGATAPG